MSIVNLNCFEKTKVRWGIFKKLSPTNLHSERSDPLAANNRIYAAVLGGRKYIVIN